MVADSVNVGDSEVLKKLQSIGLSESKAKETIKNNAVTENLLSAIKEVSCNYFLMQIIMCHA